LEASRSSNRDSRYHRSGTRRPVAMHRACHPPRPPAVGAYRGGFGPNCGRIDRANHDIRVALC
jgi:hypothetical protein